MGDLSNPKKFTNQKIQKVLVSDPATGLPINQNNGGINVYQKERTTPPVITYLAKGKYETTITAAASIDDRQISVADATNVLVNDYIVVFRPDIGRFYHGRALNAGTSPILLDNPLDIPLEIGNIVGVASAELAVDGSVTPQTFVFRGDQNAPVPVTIGVTRLIVTMALSSDADLNEFGNIPALTNGIVLRIVNGQTINIFNAKSNRDLKNYGYDLEFINAIALGTSGVSARITFSGGDKMNTTIAVGPDDNIELIVQDDLTGIDSFNFIMEGHVIIED